MDKKYSKEEKVDSGFGSLPAELEELSLTEVEDSFAEGSANGEEGSAYSSTYGSTASLSKYNCTGISSYECPVESRMTLSSAAGNAAEDNCGIDLDQDEDGDNLLHLAICLGNEELAMKLINCISKESLNARNSLGQTPLFLAVCTKMTRIIRKLIDIGADVGLVDINGNSIIHAAAEAGLYLSLKEIFTEPKCQDFEQFCLYLKYLLESRNYEGFTAFHLAARNHRMDVMHLLTNIGADVDATDLTAGFTALHHLVSTGDVGLVENFISVCNPDVNATSFSGITPLHLATGINLEPIADILLIAGADDRRETSDGFTWQPSIPNQALVSFG